MKASESLVRPPYTQRNFHQIFHKKSCRICAQVFLVISILALLWSAAQQVCSTSINSNENSYKRDIWNLDAEIGNVRDSNGAKSNERTAAFLPKGAQQAVSEKKYVTLTFGAVCGGGGLSNRLFEFVSLYGIARTLNRVPYINLYNGCVLGQIIDMESYFPNLAHAFELKIVKKNLTKGIPFAQGRCCTYDDVGKLMAYNSSQFLTIETIYLISFKYFHQYKSEVLKLLQFTSEDIVETDRNTVSTFRNEPDHKICVHIRRGDFLASSIHQHSTENFTRHAVLYLREKLKKGKIFLHSDYYSMGVHSVVTVRLGKTQ